MLIKTRMSMTAKESFPQEGSTRKMSWIRRTKKMMKPMR
jgi:hypothetical protein